MLDIDKQYIFDEHGEAIAVQIPLDQFKQIERILSSSSLQEENEQDDLQQEAELAYADRVLVVKAQGTKISASVVEDMREERIREAGGW